MPTSKDGPVLSDILVRAVSARTQREIIDGDLASSTILKELHLQPAIVKMVVAQMQTARDEDEKARILISALSVYRAMEALRGIDGVPQAKPTVYNDEVADFINAESGHKLEDQMPLHYLNASSYQKNAPSHWGNMIDRLHKSEKMGLQRLINRLLRLPRADWDPKIDVRIRTVREMSETDLTNIRDLSPMGARFAKRSFKK